MLPATRRVLTAIGILAGCVAIGLVLVWLVPDAPIAPPSGTGVIAEDDRSRGSGTIRGTVRDETGAPVAGVQVRLRTLVRKRTRTATSDSEGRAPEMTTGTDGTYAFTEVPDAFAFVLAAKDGFHVHRVEGDQSLVHPDCVVDFIARRDGAATDSVLGANLEVPSPDPAHKLVVRIVDASGKPVWPDSVKYALEGKGTGRVSTWSTCGSAKPRRRADEWLSIEIPGYMTDEGEVTKCRLVISTTRFGRRVVEVKPPPAEPVEIKIDPPANLEIRVDGFPAQPRSTALSVVLEDSRGMPAGVEADPAAHGEVDATGHARLGMLEPGPYELTLCNGDFPHRVVASRHMVLAPGDNRVSLPLGDSCCTLTVEAGATRKFWVVTLLPPDGWGSPTLAQVQTNAAGRVVFEWLRAGLYRVEIDGERRKVDVGAKTTLTW